QGFFEQKLSFEGRHLFDSLNKPAAKRSAAVVDPRRWNRTVHLRKVRISHQVQKYAFVSI
ncbi:hypothetical protein ACEUAO_20675, partial [Aeromonas caviae]|uniref:hypothetical protein n=1 Tax=Aeromonas caviae TaxID=648 RepID=UPI0038D1F24F